MKKRLSTILLFLVFAIGILVMFYPNISNWYNSRVNSYVVSNYSKTVSDKNDQDYEQIMSEAREYNQNLHSLPQSFVSGVAQDSEYINSLNVLNGMMGYLKIDSINVNLPIYHGTDEGVLQKYVGHLEGSSLPTGEIGNNTVITGHTGLPTAELLTDLIDMQLGDTFEVNVLNETFTYEVFNIVVVEPYEVDNLHAIDGKDLVTLVTCTPYGINSHRLIVQGERIEVEPIEVEPEIIKTSFDSSKIDVPILEEESKVNPWLCGFMCFVAMLVLILIVWNSYIFVQNREYRRRKKRLEKIERAKK